LERAVELIRYEDDLLRIEQSRGREKFSYRKTFAFDGDTIDQRQEELLNAPLQPNTVKIEYHVPGSLRREDAAKLYELAYFCTGHILELGTNKGLSAYIMGSANSKVEIDTIEIDERQCRFAEKNLSRFEHVKVHMSEATNWLDTAIDQGRQFAFAFVDHSHEYADVHAASARMRRVLIPGSLLAFHDFNDPRNFTQQQGYGVFEAAIEGLGNSFEFYGCFGCTGVFRAL
jgi:predicted O-methyltransferase YrrM